MRDRRRVEQEWDSFVRIKTAEVKRGAPAQIMLMREIGDLGVREAERSARNALVSMVLLRTVVRSRGKPCSTTASTPRCV